MEEQPKSQNPDSEVIDSNPETQEKKEETTLPESDEIQTTVETDRSLEKALEYKTKGNEQYKAGEYEKAITLYKEGLTWVPLDDKSNASILYSNIAMCYYYTEDYTLATECASEAINLNKEYAKPVLIRANSLYLLEKYDEAYEDYATVEKLDASLLNNNADYKRRYNDAKTKYDSSMEQKKKEVMDNLKGLGNTILGKFGLSLDNFKLQQNQNGSYNIAFEK